MAVPKRRTSRANTRTRRSQWKTSAIATSKCSHCGSQTRSHVACPTCGTYRGRLYAEAQRSEFEG
ncbi:MAG: 50S ribosomal protein L32 [Bifidobacteriaceae bacterium]|nr:50S ribosomal protein L32 [Bifidobacteriaceae bacterium]